VTNISPSADEKTVANFFSFCGTILSLRLKTFPQEADKGSEAIVVFETEAAAKTALLLTNAVIADRPISVVPYGVAEQQGFTLATPGSYHSEIHGQDVPNKQGLPPAEQRSKTSVIASLLAAGFTLGEDAIIKARQIDEQNQISSKVVAAAEVAKDKILQIDQQYQISSTIGNVVQNVTAKAKEVDASYHVSENVQNVMKNVTDTVEVGVQALQKKANESPFVQNTFSKLSQVGANVVSYVAPTAEALKANVEDIKEQTNAQIEETRRSRAINNPSEQSQQANPPAPANPESQVGQPQPKLIDDTVDEQTHS